MKYNKKQVMAYKQSPFSFYDKEPKKSKKSFTKKVEPIDRELRNAQKKGDPKNQKFVRDEGSKVAYAGMKRDSGGAKPHKGKALEKKEKLSKVEKKEFKKLPPTRAKKEKIKEDYSNLSPVKMNGNPKKKAKKVNHRRNKTAEEKAHNKHARKTEGSLVRQKLRTMLGSNKPK